MACKTCDHTMKKVGEKESWYIVFWCSRCGTIKTIWEGEKLEDNYEVPFWIERQQRIMKDGDLVREITSEENDDG